MPNKPAANDKSRLRDRIASIFRSFPEVRLAYQFGSRVSGQTGPMSDYDFGVYLRNDQKLQDIQTRISHELCKLLNSADIDLIVMNSAQTELNYAIVSSGELIYQETLAEKVNFEARILSLYGDYLPVLRMQRRELLEGNRHEARVQRYREAFGRVGRSLGQAGTASGENAF